jgi:hypothetical protein
MEHLVYLPLHLDSENISWFPLNMVYQALRDLGRRIFRVGSNGGVVTCANDTPKRGLFPQ